MAGSGNEKQSGNSSGNSMAGSRTGSEEVVVIAWLAVGMTSEEIVLEFQLNQLSNNKIQMQSFCSLPQSKLHTTFNHLLNAESSPV